MQGLVTCPIRFGHITLYLKPRVIITIRLVTHFCVTSWTPLNLACTSASCRLLWSLKRVEHRLSRTWQLLNGMQRQLRGLAALQRELGLECPGVGAVWAQLRNCLSMRSEMAHFCTNLQVPPAHSHRQMYLLHTIYIIN